MITLDSFGLLLLIQVTVTSVVGIAMSLAAELSSQKQRPKRIVRRRRCYRDRNLNRRHHWPPRR